MENQTPHIYAQDKNRNADFTKWGLPDGAIARLGRGGIQVLSMSPNGEYLAVGTLIGVWVYESSTLAPIALWDTERGLISTLDFSPHGKWLATGNTDGSIKIWDIHRGICISRMQRPQEKNGKWRDGNSQIAFSSDGHYIASSAKLTGNIYLWHAETGKRISMFSDPPEVRLKWRAPPRPLCFSNDGCLLACASSVDADGTADFISVWHVETGERVASLKGGTTLLRSLTFSPCGQHIAAADVSGTVQEWNIHTGKQQVIASYETAETVKVASHTETSSITSYYRIIPDYSASGTLLAAARHDSTLTVWDVKRGEKRNVFEHHEPITHIYFSNQKHRNGENSSSVVAFASAEEINVWTLDNPYTGTPISRYVLFPDVIAFSPDGRTLVSAGFAPATSWDIVTRQPQRLMSRAETKGRSQKSIRSIHISSAGKIYALGVFQNILTVWDLETNQTIATLTEHNEYVLTAAFAPTGEQWASGSHNGELYVWKKQGTRKKLLGHTDAIQTLAFSSDEKCLLSASSDGTVRLWHVASGEEIASLSLARLDTKHYLDTFPSKLISTQQRRSCERENTSPHSEMKAIAFSPSGNVIAGGIFGEIRFWNADTYETCLAIRLPQGCQRPYALDFSRCGRYLASGSWWQNTEKVSIRLWEVATGENIVTFWGHPTDVQDLAFSPDGSLLASGSLDGTVLLWDLTPYLQNETP